MKKEVVRDCQELGVLFVYVLAGAAEAVCGLIRICRCSRNIDMEQENCGALLKPPLIHSHANIDER